VPSDELLSVRDTARSLGVSYSTIKTWIHNKKLRSRVTSGGHHRIQTSEIEKLVPRTIELDVFANRKNVRRISERNQLVGQIVGVCYDGLMAHVTLMVSGQRVSAIITLDAAREMALKKGQRVAALIQATQVFVISV
jgi:molybdopterin-binding protein